MHNRDESIDILPFAQVKAVIERVIGNMLRSPSILRAAALLPHTPVTTHTFPALIPKRRIEVPSQFLDLPLRKDILHRAVIFERDAMRQGTASSKTRAEVSGSTRKIRPQKGSGRARLGDRTSPMLRGGGRAHGPKPRDFSTELPRKVYNLAVRGTFSHLFQTGKMVVVDGAIDFNTHKTAVGQEFLETHGFAKGKEPNGRTLIVVNSKRRNLETACGNLGHLMEVTRLDELLVSEILKYPRVLIERKALLETEEMTRLENKYKHIVVDKSPASELAPAESLAAAGSVSTQT